MIPTLPPYLNKKKYLQNMDKKVACDQCWMLVLPKNMKKHKSRDICAETRYHKLQNMVFPGEEIGLPSDPKEKFIARIQKDKQYATDIWEELSHLREKVQNYKETLHKFSSLCETSLNNIEKTPSFSQKLESLNPALAKLWTEFNVWQSESEFSESPIDFSVVHSFLSFKFQSLKRENKQRMFAKFYAKFKHILKLYNRDIVIENRTHYDRTTARVRSLPQKIKPCLEPEEIAEMVGVLYKDDEKQLFLAIIFLAVYALRINSLMTFKLDHMNKQTNEITFYDIKTMIYFKRQNFVEKYIEMIYDKAALDSRIGRFMFGKRSLNRNNQDSYIAENFAPFSSLSKDENVAAEMIISREEIKRRKNAFNKKVNKFLHDFLSEKYPPKSYYLTSHMFRVTSSQNIFKQTFEESINVAKNNINHTKQSKNWEFYIPPDIVTDNCEKLLNLIDEEIEKVDKEKKRNEEEKQRNLRRLISKNEKKRASSLSKDKKSK